MPIWRWNTRLRLPIDPGAEQFTDVWHKAIYQDLAKLMTADNAIRRRVQGRPLDRFLVDMENYDIPAKVPVVIRGSRPLRLLLGNA